MRELDAPFVDAHQLERGARDVCRRPRPPRHAAHECRLAGAEISGQKQEVATLEVAAEGLTGSLGFRR
jgi:hypothetical protein